MRPKSIILFEQAFLASVALGLVGMVFSWSALEAELQDPAIQAVGLGQGFLVGTVFATVAISLLLWFFIAKRASRVAKWIFVVLVTIGTLSTLISLAGAGVSMGVASLVGLINTALQIFAAYQLFQPDAKAWLATGGRDGPVDPATFD